MEEKTTPTREEELARREAHCWPSGKPSWKKSRPPLRPPKPRVKPAKRSCWTTMTPISSTRKRKLYDKFPLTVHQMDIIIGVLFALIVLFLVLGLTHTSFFGLFGG